MSIPFLLLSARSAPDGAPTLADPSQTFRKAKQAASQLYRDHQTTFYCACDYRKVNGKLRVDLASCGYQVRKQPGRAGRVEWEHMVPGGVRQKGLC